MMNVLVVDPIYSHLCSFVDFFANYGCKSCGFQLTSDALEYCEQGFVPQLLLVGADSKGEVFGVPLWKIGFCFASTLRERKPYMIALDVFKQRVHKALCEEVGFDVYDQKPIQLHRLLTWIKEAERV